MIYLIFKIPFDVGFDWYENTDTEEAWLILLDLWFTVDIMLNFKTGYISNGTAVMHPKKIRYHYLAGWFFIDLIGTIPFKYFVPEGEKGKSIKLSKFFKIPKLLRISRVLKYMRNNKQVYDIFKVFIFIIISIHLGACLWILAIDPCETGYIVGTSPHCSQNVVFDVYTEALHVSTVMMLGISNTHIMSSTENLDSVIPQTLNKSQLQIISIVFMVYGLYLGALMISEMTVYVMGKTQGSSAFQRKIDRVNHEMEYYAVPFELRGKVKAYYDYIWVNQKQYDEKIGLLSDRSMSTDLQRQLALHLFKDVVTHISFFADVDDIVLGQICLSLKTLVFLPYDMVLFKGDVGKELFIIAKGVVEVMRDDLPEDKRQMANQILLRSGSFFGEIALVMEVRRTCSVQARTICEINILHQATFDDILREHPDFAKRMNELVVARQMETSLARLGVDPTHAKFRQADLDFANEAVNAQMQAGLFRRENTGGGVSNPPATSPPADHLVNLPLSGSFLNKKIFPGGPDAGPVLEIGSPTPPSDGENVNLFDEMERRKSVGAITEENGRLYHRPTIQEGQKPPKSSPLTQDLSQSFNRKDRRVTSNTIQGHFNLNNTYDIGKVHTSILLGGTQTTLGDESSASSGATPAANNRVTRIINDRNNAKAGGKNESQELKLISTRMSRTEQMLEQILDKLDPLKSGIMEEEVGGS